MAFCLFPFPHFFHKVKQQTNSQITCVEFALIASTPMQLNDPLYLGVISRLCKTTLDKK